MAQTGLSGAPGCELISGNQFMEDDYSSDHGNTAPTSTLNGTSEGLLTKTAYPNIYKICAWIKAREMLRVHNAFCTRHTERYDVQLGRQPRLEFIQSCSGCYPLSREISIAVQYQRMTDRLGVEDSTVVAQLRNIALAAGDRSETHAIIGVQ
jgi:hypothetical protein